MEILNIFNPLLLDKNKSKNRKKQKITDPVLSCYKDKTILELETDYKKLESQILPLKTSSEKYKTLVIELKILKNLIKNKLKHGK